MIRRILTAALERLACGVPSIPAFEFAVTSHPGATVADVRTARALFDVLCAKARR